MRHGVKLNRLGRKTAHRKALMRNLSIQLIQNKRIVTTLAKAKALRVFVEPLLTRSKEDNMANRRLVFSYLNDKDIIGELFTTVGGKIGSRPGGYTRIIKLAPRIGDAADMAMIELVDFNEIYNTTTSTDTGKKKTRRSRAGATKTTAVATETKEEEVVDTAIVDAKVVEAEVVDTPIVEDVAIESPEHTDDTTPTTEEGENKEA